MPAGGTRFKAGVTQQIGILTNDDLLCDGKILGVGSTLRQGDCTRQGVGAQGVHVQRGRIPGDCYICGCPVCESDGDCFGQPQVSVNIRHILVVVDDDCFGCWGSDLSDIHANGFFSMYCAREPGHEHGQNKCKGKDSHVVLVDSHFCTSLKCVRRWNIIQ